MAFEFYDVLQVAREATADEIKRAYRKRAMESHPDRHKGDKAREAEFKKVNEAYATLSDETKRAHYDRSGGNASDSHFGGGGFSQEFDFSDIFEQFFGGGFAGGGSGRGHRRQEVGDDIEIRLKTSFEKSVKGGFEEVAYERKRVCPDCAGSGSEKGKDPKSCPDCHGSGKVRQQVRTVFGTVEQLAGCPRCRATGKIVEHPCGKCRGERYVVFKTERKIDVPAGIENGMTVKFRNEGHEGIDGNGDLYVRFDIPETEGKLAREGADLVFTLELDPVEMVLGCTKKVEIPVIGTKEIEIKSGSQHGKIVKFRNEGAQKIPAGGKGDLIVVFYVRIPEKISSKERELYGEIAKGRGISESSHGGIFGKLFE